MSQHPNEGVNPFLRKQGNGGDDGGGGEPTPPPHHTPSPNPTPAPPPTPIPPPITVVPLGPIAADGTALTVTRDAQGRLIGASGVGTDGTAHRLTIEPVILTDKTRQNRYAATRTTFFANNQPYFFLTTSVSIQRQTFGLSASTPTKQFSYIADYSTANQTNHALIVAKARTGRTFGTEKYGAIALNVPSFSATTSSVNLSLDQQFDQQTLGKISYFAPLLKSEFDTYHATFTSSGLSLNASPLDLTKSLKHAVAWGFGAALGASPGCIAFTLVPGVGWAGAGLCLLIAAEGGADASLWSDVIDDADSSVEVPEVVAPTSPTDAGVMLPEDAGVPLYSAPPSPAQCLPDDSGQPNQSIDPGQSTSPTSADGGDGTDGGTTDEGTGVSDGGGGCFVAGTVVMTTRGLLPIELVQVGDEIHTYDLQTADTVTQRVTNTIRAQGEELLRVCFEAEELSCTPNHRFYTGTWTPASKLKIGDRVLSLDGQWKEIQAVWGEKQQEAVFNLNVERTHNYFVGRTALLVHNVKVTGGPDPDPEPDPEDPLLKRTGPKPGLDIDGKKTGPKQDPGSDISAQA